MGGCIAVVCLFVFGGVDWLGCWVLDTMRM
jgi:hypothetical protein